VEVSNHFNAERIGPGPYGKAGCTPSRYLNN
jgi:hypothetical protein